MKRILFCRTGVPSRRGLATATSSSTIKEEVRKFGAVGSDWWDESSTNGTGPLHAMNPVRVSFIRESLATQLGRSDMGPLDQLRGLDILDVGCGGGLLSEALARLGANVSAIDPSTAVINARTHSEADDQTSNIQYKQSTIEDISKSGKKFDAVCSLEVMEHVENPLLFIHACSKSLKPGGSMFFSTMNRTMKSYGMTILGAEYIMRALPVGTHDWNKYITPKEMSEMIETVGKVKKINGMVLQPNVYQGLTGSWKLSENDFDVNYIVHGVKDEDDDIEK